MTTAFATADARSGARPQSRPAEPYRAVIDGATARALRDETPASAPRLVAAPAVSRGARPRVAFAVLVVGGMAVVLGTQLLISIQTAGDAYQLQSLQATQVQLSRAQQVATERLELLSSPQHIAAAAQAQGMIASVAPAYLRVRDGVVLGSTTPASRGDAEQATSAAVPNALLTR